MHKQLRDILATIEISRGIPGILNEVAEFTRECADSANGCNDTGSAKEYKTDAILIDKLASTIENRN